ncbi:MAG TPA: type II toxin-antitoxin system HicA family toxin [Hyphomicrobiaceae bacterium]|jgi:hypothetical protein
MASYTPEVLRIPREYGCTFVRKGKGDHETWYSPITKHNFPVDGNIRSRHWANIVLKQAGIEKKF